MSRTHQAKKESYSLTKNSGYIKLVTELSLQSPGKCKRALIQLCSIHSFTKHLRVKRMHTCQSRERNFFLAQHSQSSSMYMCMCMCKCVNVYVYVHSNIKISDYFEGLAGDRTIFWIQNTAFLNWVLRLSTHQEHSTLTPWWHFSEEPKEYGPGMRISNDLTSPSDRTQGSLTKWAATTCLMSHLSQKSLVEIWLLANMATCTTNCTAINCILILCLLTTSKILNIWIIHSEAATYKAEQKEFRRENDYTEQRRRLTQGTLLY